MKLRISPSWRKSTYFFLTLLILLIAVTWPSLYLMNESPHKFVLEYSNSTIKHDYEPTDLIARLWRKEKIVLLTFDDAPADPAIDRKILDVLDRHSAKSIWFFNCKHFDETGQKGLRAIEVAKEIADRGHLIGNHGYNHENLEKLDFENPARLDHEIGGCSSRIHEIVGMRPKFFRPPWGLATENAENIIRKEGMNSLLWSSNFNDSGSRWTTSSYKNYILHADQSGLKINVEEGDVILFHDNAHTADTLDAILTALETAGFKFVLPSQ